MVPSSGHNELLDSGLWNSIWPDWMNEIYSFVQHAPSQQKRPAINFPQSSFHGSSSNPISTTTTEAAATVTSTTSDQTSTVTDLSAITSALLPNPTSGSNPVITLTTSSPSSTVPNLTIIYASTMSPTDITLPPFIEEESSNQHEFEIEPPDSSPLDLIITSSESTNTTSTTSMPVVVQAIVNATVNATVVSAGQQPGNSTNRDESTAAGTLPFYFHS